MSKEPVLVLDSLLSMHKALVSIPVLKKNRKHGLGQCLFSCMCVLGWIFVVILVFVFLLFRGQF